MWFSDVSVLLLLDANEVCFFLALAVLALFYRQYKIYEAEAEREEMIEDFLNTDENLAPVRI